MKKCKQCGEKFKSGFRGRKLFCSNKCGQRWWNHYHSQNRTRDVTCVVCGNPLPKQRHSYCSDRCRQLNAQKRLKNYAKKYSSDFFIDVCLNCTQEQCDGDCEQINKLIGDDK